MADPFEIKDSGKRQEFASGMVRDTTDGKVNYLRILEGPMFDRWAIHMTKGAGKYPDVKPGVANWTLANGEAEYMRFRQSAFSHFRKWLRGDRDEDHAAAIFFNLNGAEFVREKLNVEEHVKDVMPVDAPVAGTDDRPFGPDRPCSNPRCGCCHPNISGVL